MKKNDAKLLNIARQLLDLIATDAYTSGDSFEFMMVEQSVADCIERLPLPHGLKQVRGAISKSKGSNELKDVALSLVTFKASSSAKLSDDVALYILNCSQDKRIPGILAQQLGLSDIVRARAEKMAASSIVE